MASSKEGARKQEKGDDEGLAASSTETKVRGLGSGGQGALADDGEDGGEDADDDEDDEDDDDLDKEDADGVDEALEDDALRELSTVGREKVSWV